MREITQVETPQLLLVDDDPNLILLVKDYLEFQGYNVLTADNGHEALTILNQKIPDLIICDVMMPEMDGYCFAQKVQSDSRTTGIPIIFLSAKGSPKERIKGLQSGADVYMVKPFEPEELAAQVNASIQKTRALIKHGQRISSLMPTVEVASQVKLTRTELKVIQLVAQGLANAEVADILGVNKRTVETHVSNMLKKTGLKNRTELSRWAIETRQAS